MKSTRFTLSLLALLCGSTSSFGQGSAFLYHGQLKESNLPVSGPYDLRFGLWNNATNGSPVGSPLQLDGVAVTSSRFVATLDFGLAAFDGEPRWLEAAVRPSASSGEFVVLSPRQPITAIPYAIRSTVASRLATSTNQPLELYAGTLRALRLELGTNDSRAAVNFIGGASGNAVAPGVIGATIGGGGVAVTATNGRPHFIANNFATICGGVGNCVTGEVSTICGGYQNAVHYECEYSFIGGGYENTMVVGADFGVIGGGELNSVAADWGVVAGGKENAVQDDARFSTISGGYRNTVAPETYYTTIAGGAQNSIGNAATFASVGGGFNNHVQPQATYATVSGGDSAVASRKGQWAYANGAFANPGDAQCSVHILRATSLNSAPSTELSLNGDKSLQRLTIPPGSRWSFEALIVAGTADGATAGFQVKGSVKNVGGTTRLVGTPSVTPLGADTSASAWSVAVQADDEADALVFKATGDARTIRWVATTRAVELIF